MTTQISPATPGRSMRSAQSRRTSKSSLFPFTAHLSDIVNIDDLDDASSQVSDDEDCLSKPLPPFLHPLGRTYHANLLLAGLVTYMDRPTKTLPRRSSTIYALPALSDSVSSDDSVSLPTPDTSFSAAVSPTVTLYELPSPQPAAQEPTPQPPSPASSMELFGSACMPRRMGSKRKRPDIAPPMSKYKHARTGSSPAPTRATLPLLVPRNLVHIPPFFPPRARLEAEFCHYGYLSYLYEYTRPNASSSTLSLRKSYSAGHSRNSSGGTLRSFRARARASVMSLPNPRASRLSLVSFRRSRIEPRLKDALEISHLLSQINTERYRVFERVQLLKRIVSLNGGRYSEKDMKREQEKGWQLAKVTLPRILYVDREWNDWCMI